MTITRILPTVILMMIMISCSAPKHSAVPQQKKINNSNLLPSHFQELEFDKLDYTPPFPGDYRVELDSGVFAYMVKDSSLALVKIKMIFKGLVYPQKPADVSLNSLYSSLLINGGTVKLSPKQMEDSLEYNAAYISASLGDNTSTLGLNTLKKDVYPMLNLLKHAILTPKYDKEVLELNKKKTVENIKHRFDKPWSVSSRAYEYIMYGHHPHNWLTSKKDVQRVNRSKLRKITGRGFNLNNLIISVSGDFNKQTMIDSLNTFIADLKKSQNPIDTIIYNESKQPGVFLVDKDFKQATIQVGFPGLRRPHPDYYKLSVASYIFGGGGFTSRLVTKVRTEAGLAYSVRSFVQSDYFRDGTVGFYLQTKAESGATAVELCFEEMKRMIDSGITSEELQKAKTGLIQSLPSMFDTPTATANIFAQSEIWGRKTDHFIQYPKIIESLTAEDINAVFKKYFSIDKARVIVVGPKDILHAPLTKIQSSVFKSEKISELSLKTLQKRD